MINGMSGDTNGGVCLIKEYDYFTYTQDTSGCTCSNITGYTTSYIPMGTYILPYKNTNNNYSINTLDTSLSIVVSSITGFAETYINDLVTTGYTSYDNSGFENRIIYDSTLDQYFYFENDINSTNCILNTTPMWAIIDTVTNGIWLSGGTTNYWYNEMDNCGNNTGNEIVYSMDINPNSATYKQTASIYKCSVSIPIVTIYSITGTTFNSAIINFEIINSGNTISSTGILYGTDQNILNWLNVSGVTNNIEITGLTSGTTYYVKAYAINEIGTGYSAEDNFTTQNPMILYVPTVLSLNQTGTTLSGSTFNGLITSDGGSPITDNGFYYGNISGTTTGSTQMSLSGTTIGNFSEFIGGFGINTQHFYKAYATNAIGTTLSDIEIEFYTLANTPGNPTVNNILIV